MFQTKHCNFIAFLIGKHRSNATAVVNLYGPCVSVNAANAYNCWIFNKQLVK